MQLSRHTDYALRLLIHLASTQDRLVQIAEVAEAQAISRTHLMKIANELARAGLIEAVRGRCGGIRLARDAGAIGLKQILDVTEPTCGLIDCTGCRLVRRCRLPGILDQAQIAFQTVLADHTLADVVHQRMAGA